MTTLQRKDLALAIKAVDATRRRFVGVATQEVEDRLGDIVEVRGVDTTAFERNPALLADHDHTFILGRVTRLWVEARPEGDALVFEADVLPAGTSARIDERWAAIAAGAASGISIGFLGVAGEERRASTGRTGYRFTKTTLLEISSVAVPACATCLIEQRAICAHGGPARHLADDAEAVLRLTDGSLDDTVRLVLDDDRVTFDAPTFARAFREVLATEVRAALEARDGERVRINSGDMAVALAEVVSGEVQRHLRVMRGRLD